MADPFAVMMLFLAMGFMGLFATGSDDGDMSDSDASDDANASGTTDETDASTIIPLEQALNAVNVVYDDTSDADNGIVTGTVGVDLLFGSLEAGGINGGEDDTTNPNDTITAGAGDDTVVAGNGDDSILGEEGNDQIAGGTGADTIDGGLGADLMIGNDGNDTFILTPEAGVTDVISDFRNIEGDQDFVDMTPHFAHLGELRTSFDEGTTKLNVTDDYVVDFKGTSAESFTTATTGLAENDAPIAADDTESIDLRDGSVTTVQMFLVEGNFAEEGETGADSDPNGAVDELAISTINGAEVEPGDTVNIQPGVDVTVRADGLAAGVEIDPSFFEGAGSVNFTYTVDDAYDARSNVATATLNFTVNQQIT